jgi:hypothetical protein
MTDVRFDKSALMIKKKQKQLEDNLSQILDILSRSDNPLSSREIFQKNKTETTKGEKDPGGIYEYKDNSTKNMSLRTIQRGLKVLYTNGSVQKSNNKYTITKVGRRELMFKQFAQGYGTMSLNGLMDLSFPTINTLDNNLGRLVEIFGVYVVYALIEATRLIMGSKRGTEEYWYSANLKSGKSREAKLFNSWIKDVFNPWHMLNIFLTAVSNSDDSKGPHNKSKREKTLIKQRIAQYPIENTSQMIRVNSFLNPKYNNESNEYCTLDLMFQRLSEISGNSDIKYYQDLFKQRSFHFYKIRCSYSDDQLLYEPDCEKLKDSLRKQFPLYCERLLKIDKLFYSIHPQ